MATLTYVYPESTAVLGPLATSAQPHAYDLCAQHASSLSVPRGWQVIRLASDLEPAPPSEDDLEALADAVREASRRSKPRVAEFQAEAAPVTHQTPSPEPLETYDGIEIARKGHLRVLRGAAGEAHVPHHSDDEILTQN